MTEILYVFQCGDADLYGLTHDETGEILPREVCAGGWRLLKKADWDGRHSSWGLDVRWQEMQDAAMAGLSLNGFFLTESVGLPEVLRHP